MGSGVESVFWRGRDFLIKCCCEVFEGVVVDCNF